MRQERSGEPGENQHPSALPWLKRTIGREAGSHRSDGELLRCFLGSRDESAFAALVQRHGPMVTGVCRRVLRDAHAVEDAFQATFLVLAQKAKALREREILGDWLHGVAFHTALKALAMTIRRRQREKQAARTEAVHPREKPEWLEALDEEIRTLPARHRRLIVLCDLRQMKRFQVARELNVSPGTVASGLARARQLLAKRLAARGHVVSTGMLAAGLMQAAQAQSVPWQCLPTLMQSVMVLGTGGGMAVSTHVGILVKSVLGGMAASKVKTVIVGVILSAGLWGAVSLGHGGTSGTGASVHANPVLARTQAGMNDPAALRQSATPAELGRQKERSGLAVKEKRQPQPPVDLPPRLLQVVDPMQEVGTEEEALSLLQLTAEQRSQFDQLRKEMDQATQEMYRMRTGYVERGQQLNRFWRAGLQQIFTAEQYQRYCRYWESRQSPRVAHGVGG